MARVYEDGSYSWSSPTYLEDYSHQYGISTLSFNENSARASSLFTIFEGENESYFLIDGKFASKAELDALIESRKDIKEVTWTTYTLGKIPAKGYIRNDLNSITAESNCLVALGGVPFFLSLLCILLLKIAFAYFASFPLDNRQKMWYNL
jgi:hypothetical protein